MERLTFILFLGGIFVCQGYVDKCYCPGDTDFNFDMERKMWELRTEATKDFEVVFKPRPQKEGVPEISILKKMFPQLTLKELNEMTLEGFNKYRDDAKDRESERKKNMNQHSHSGDKSKENTPEKKPEREGTIEGDSRKDGKPNPSENGGNMTDSTGQGKNMTSPTNTDKQDQEGSPNKVPEKERENDGSSQKTRKKRQTNGKESDQPPRPPSDDPREGDSRPTNQTDRPRNETGANDQKPKPKEGGNGLNGTDDAREPPKGSDNNQTRPGNNSTDDLKPMEGQKPPGDTNSRPDGSHPQPEGDGTRPKEDRTEPKPGEGKPEDKGEPHEKNKTDTGQNKPTTVVENESRSNTSNPNSNRTQSGGQPPRESSKPDNGTKNPNTDSGATRPKPSDGSTPNPTKPDESKPKPNEIGGVNQKPAKPNEPQPKLNETGGGNQRPATPEDSQPSKGSDNAGNEQGSDKERPRPKPKPMKKDSAKPIAPIGVTPVSGSLKRAQACSCPAKAKIMKELTFDQVDPDPMLEDTTSEAFAKFKSEQETILNEALGKNGVLKAKGFAGINILSVSIGPQPDVSSRRKRETNAVTAQTQSECTGSCDPNDLDTAVNGTSGVSSTDPATAASPCSKTSLTAMTNPPPSHLVSTLANDAMIDSSFYLHLTCSRSGSDEYRQYQETAPLTDDSLDNKVGVLCNDGAFAERAWPDETNCQVVETCANIPSPPNASLLLPPGSNEIAGGSSLFYVCSDPEALLNDGSGLNNFEIKCEGTQLKVNRNGSMVDFDPTTHFPTCLSQCKTLFIGNKQYAPRVQNGTTPVIRAGETLPFDCPNGMYVENMAYNVSSVDGNCQADGKFQIETRKCFLIPCTQEDIDDVPPGDNNGDMVTTATGEIMPAESIFFKCSDPLKVPSNGREEIEALCMKGGNFSVTNWPTAPYCLRTCSNFPNITKMAVVDRSPVLEGRTVEYKCRNAKKIPATGQKVLVPCEADGKFQYEDAGFPLTNYPDCVTGCVVFPTIEHFKPKIRLPLLPGASVEYECERNGFVPHTDTNLVMECQGNGTFTPTTAIPQCVPVETCRQKDYPTHPNYIVFDNTTVSYRQNQFLQMVCANDDLVTESQNFSSVTFGIKCTKNATTNEFKFEENVQWPRCIPKKCIKVMAKHHNLTNTCQCGFDECSEYIYNTIPNQCPEVPTGPFCSLEPYHDWSGEIAELFQGDAPTEVPTASELTQLAVMETELDMTIAEIEAILTAEPNTTTPARRKRSNVPLICSELQAKVVKIQDMLAIGVTNKVFPISEVILQCSFLRRSTVTKEDCDDEKVDLTGSLTTLKAKVQESKTTIEELIEDNKAAEILWAEAVAEANAKAANETQHRLEEAKTYNGISVSSNSTTNNTEETPQKMDEQKQMNATDATDETVITNIGGTGNSEEAKNKTNNGNNNGNNMKTRKKRAAFIKTLIRQKRGLMFRCNTSMVYGISFKDMHHPEGIMADRCCCPNFQGEFFKCMATIDSPWNNVLSSVRSAFFKEKYKMVEQEIRFLIKSTNYSEIAMSGQMGNFSFIGLNNTGNKIGAVFHVVLKWPHWDNHVRIENSFLKAAEMYAKQTEDEEHILGKMVQGKFERNLYVLESGKKGIECVRSPFPDPPGFDAKNGTNSLTSEVSKEDENGWLVFVMVPLAIICFLGILIHLVFKSKACLIRYWV
ncbi:uncharacterized protein LOC131889396 isoform X2 [Tigriopus californicus]|uniref:uncharacterized protein LOC131889396 isoform X2 n=1 Tax=Tigriopus californicus TaxID=6832 RepID=UPI0027D9EB06|nr:uncharacterized protein LOC131889396 isoform X2 [Tigriopus californicus]|eukprot:TCALIF_07140-PA protein Name:"Protein of unknown function" AED:0.00 eAED:0.00 QI:91/1/1/1/0.85/0.87/8/216/1684